MNKALIGTASFLMAVSMTAGCQPASESKTTGTKTEATSEKVDLGVEENRFGYSLGYNMGKGLGADFPNMNLNALKAGMQAAINGGEPEISEEDMRKAIQDGQKKAMDARRDKADADGQANLEAGKKFLAENGKKEGVITTESGLQYKVLTEGKGKSPKATDTVSVHYHGTLPSGDVFDSSVERGSPATFGLNRVIKGWTEGVQLMKEGSKYQFYIPSDLAYGERGPSPKIGPNQVLIFDVELLEVKGE